MTGFKFKKAVQALNYLAKLEGGAINKMKALKLIWLADRFHLRRFARTIIGDTYFAMEFGPVASGTKDLAEGNDFIFESEAEKAYRNLHISTIDKLKYKSTGEVDFLLFSKTDIDSLNSVYEVFGKYDQFELSKISHDFPEWSKLSDSLKAGISRVEMNYLDFFEKVPGGFQIFDEPEKEILLVREIFLENQRLTF